MSSAILSQTGFLILLSLFITGAVSALIFRRNDQFANFFGSFFAVMGSAWGVIFALLSLSAKTPQIYEIGTASFPLLSWSFNIDKLSAFFIFIISLISLFCSIYGIGYAKHFYKKYNIGSLGFFYNTFILGMLAVVSASNALFFLIAWEIMSLASYFLVVYDRKDENNVKAGFLYFVMTHIGTAFIILSFMLFYKFTGSFDFEIIKENISNIPPFAKSAIFLLALAGFGTKAGIIPLHIWLPSAHPAAPSHVSALMSGVMIKTGIYMMIKIFMDIFTDAPLWLGLAILIIGSASSLLGVLYALTEHDLKRLLAYHSIENIGIILLGLGSALAFAALDMPGLAVVGIAAALFHTLNHATFKSLLFLGAGSVISQTHTRNIEEYGGLIKYMPQTAFFFLIGSMAISALPPFNGFFSEWLTFQALFKGMTALDASAKWVFLISAGSLALTSGLALACFVKAFGTTFLARPRSKEVKHAKESAFTLRFGMAMLAVLSLAFGLFSGRISLALAKIGEGLGGIAAGGSSAISVSSAQNVIIIDGGFSSISAPAIAIFIAIPLLAAAIAVIYLINKNQKIKIGATWDCGTELTPRMEITSTGFSRSIIMIFKGILKPSKQMDIEYHDADIRYFPRSRTIALGITDAYNIYLSEPLHNFIINISDRAKKIQSGNVNTYILYIFIALLAVIFFAIF